MKFPVLVKGAKGAFLYFVIGAIATIVLYQTTNRIHLYEPVLLNFSWVDHALPLIPWTVWIYFSEYLIFIVSWLWLKDDFERTKYFFSYMAILLISVAIFIVYPTTFPREDFPLEGYPRSLTIIAFEYLRNEMDRPANCLPSLHVSSCYIAAFVFWNYNRKKFWFFFVWATLVAVSTVTTKQHYAIDSLAAIILTYVCYVYFYRFAQYRHQEPPVASLKENQMRVGSSR